MAYFNLDLESENEYGVDPIILGLRLWSNQSL